MTGLNYLLNFKINKLTLPDQVGNIMKVIDLVDDVFINDVSGKGFVIGDNNNLIPLEKGM